MKVNKKITAMLLSAVIAAAPAAAPIMDVQTVAAATTTTKTLKNAWSQNHKYYYDKNGKKVTGVKKIGKYTYVFAKNGKLVTNKKYYKYNAKTYYKIAKNGLAPHAWVEIKSNGKTYVYDPNFQSEFGKKGYTGYKITYGQKGTLQYVKTSKVR